MTGIEVIERNIVDRILLRRRYFRNRRVGYRHIVRFNEYGFRNKQYARFTVTLVVTEREFRSVRNHRIVFFYRIREHGPFRTVLIKILRRRAISDLVPIVAESRSLYINFYGRRASRSSRCTRQLKFRCTCAVIRIVAVISSSVNKRLTGIEVIERNIVNRILLRRRYSRNRRVRYRCIYGNVFFGYFILQIGFYRNACTNRGRFRCIIRSIISKPTLNRITFNRGYLHHIAIGMRFRVQNRRSILVIEVYLILIQESFQFCLLFRCKLICFCRRFICFK